MSLIRTRNILFIGICLALAAGSVVQAGTNTWTLDGPEGGELVSLAVDPRDPSVVYAAARAGGFWKTLDGGDRWVSIQGDFIDTNAEAVALHPDDPDVLFGLTNSRLVRSEDGGPWTSVSSDLDGFFFSGALRFDSEDSNILYLGSNNNGVLKSTDGGQTWAVLGPAEVSNVLFVSQDPSDTAVLYIGGFFTQSLFRSLDGGGTWTDLGPAAPGTYVQDLAVDPVNPDILWAATPRGLFRSLDRGSTWQVQNAGLTSSDILMVRFDPRDPQTLFASARFGTGLARSVDRGETWTVAPLDRQTSAIEDLAFDAGGGNTLYLAVGRGGGVYRSADDGATWQWASDGLTAATVTGLAVDPLSGTVLAASSGSGVFRREGMGDWRPLLNSPRDGFCCLDVVAAPDLANTFYASGGQGIYLSTDGGTTWEPRLVGGLLPFLAENLIVDPTNSQRLFMAAFGGVVMSVDGGLSWEFLTEGLPVGELVTDVAVDPGNPQVLYASTSSLLYRSVDGGDSWTPLNGETPLDFRPSAVAVSHFDSDLLLVGTVSDGVLRSVDGGITWEDVGVSDNAFVREVEFNELGSASAVTFRGLWRSAFGGQFWEPLGELDAASAAVFVAAVQGGPVTTSFIGTAGASVWSLTEGCIPSDTVLCLDDAPGDRRFALSMDYNTLQGGPQSGLAEVTVLEELGIRQGGVFSFFGRQNPEVLVKVLDGCAFNDRYWVFAAATTNVGFHLNVLDTRTGQSRLYSNQDGIVATTITDTDALATCPLPGGPTGTSSSPVKIPSEGSVESISLASGMQQGSIEKRMPEKGVPGPCQADATTLCIDDAPGDQRFAVRLRYDTALGAGASGDAMATSLATLGVTDGGILSFFDVSNPEVLIKVINGCDFNGHYWVFYAAATNLGFRVEVEDTSAGVVWDATNPDGLDALTVTDTSALATCDG